MTSAIRMEAVFVPRIMVPMYQSAWCHNLTDHSMNPFHYENFMSHLRFLKLSV